MIVKITAMIHTIRYVLALSFFVAKAHTTNTRDTANIAAETYDAMLYDDVLNFVVHTDISDKPAIASSITNYI